mgnify:CR=1 FL=1
MLGLGMPIKITAAGGLYHYADTITTPDTLSVHFDFAEVPVHWRHRLWGATEFDSTTTNGIFFFGTQGTIFASDRKWILVGPNGDKTEHEASVDMGALQMADFLAAVKERRPPLCTVADAFQSTATVQLAMISYETGTTVRWDPERLVIMDNPQASALLKRAYRAPWQHPYDE